MQKTEKLFILKFLFVLATIKLLKFRRKNGFGRKQTKSD